MPKPARQLPLALTVGEPGGIGPELILRVFRERASIPVSAFYVLADPAFLALRGRSMGWNVPIRQCTVEQAAVTWPEALPVVPVGHTMGNAPGSLNPADAPAVIAAIELAVRHVAQGLCSGIVTAPIHKSNLYAAGFAFPGHTEFLGHLALGHWPKRAANPVMMLAGPDLRTVPVTVHIALADVPRHLTMERIVEVGEITARDLTSRFGIANPRLSVAGLNPHAGENRAMGHEDLDIIAPAVAELRTRGIDASGPWPADTLFHARARQHYDAVLAMYHDQALIPVKTLAFDETVNVTLGLPFIRTSPDHGTALDIAGQGIARPESLIAALRLAAEMAERDV